MHMKPIEWDESLEQAVQEFECQCTGMNITLVRNALARAADITDKLYESRSGLDGEAVDNIVWSLKSIISDAQEAASPAQGGGVMLNQEETGEVGDLVMDALVKARRIRLVTDLKAREFTHQDNDNPDHVLNNYIFCEIDSLIKTLNEADNIIS